MRMRRRLAAGRPVRIESLEPRQLLAVVISEFMASNQTAWADDDGNYSDWIELHNAGNQPVNLNGWHLTDDANNLTKWRFPAVSLAADSYVLVYASDQDRTNPASPLHTSFKLSADGEYLGIVRPDGVTVEDSYAPAFPTQRPDISYGIGADGVTRGFFAASTPGRANGIALPDDADAVVISELMYSLPRVGILDPEPTRFEYVELLNRGLRPVDVTGWQFTRGIDFTLPSATIPAGGTLVVAADVAAFATVYPTVTNVVGGWTGKLSNSGETVELVNAAGVLVDQVRYADQGDWALRTPGPLDRGATGWAWTANHDGGGHSLELINPRASNDEGQNWAASLLPGGTPGRTNSRNTDNIAPLILDVRHDPPLPRANEPVAITAEIRDDYAGSVQVTTSWRVAGDDAWQQATMYDDGTHGDGAAGDGVFGTVLPGQSDLAVVEFFVSAADPTGLVRHWPAVTTNGLHETNALYQVIDAFDAQQAWVPGTPPIYHVIMTPAERLEFTNINRQSNAQFNATFIAVTGTGIDVRYNAGVRVRGSGSRDDPIPNNRVNLPSDQPWEGVTAINLNQRNPINQIAGSVIYQMANVPVSTSHAVRVFSNGVDLKNGGIYVHQEVMDNEYAQNHYPTDSGGNLYRGRRPDESPPGGQGAGLVYFGEDPAPYVSYLKETNSSEADWSDVIELTRVLNTTSDAEYASEVRQVVDVEQWFRAMAINALIDNNEYGLLTGDPLGDDFAMYRGVEDPRFQMIPYDWDTLFGSVNRSILRPLAVPRLNRLITNPEFQAEYYDQFLHVIDTVLQSGELGPALDLALQSVAPANEIRRIKQFLVDRSNFVRNLIGSQLTVDSSLPQVDGVVRSSQGAIALNGRFPQATTKAVRVNDELASLVLSNGNWRFASSETDRATLLDFGADWRFHDQGVDLGTAWRTSQFDDSSWSVGPAELGYGDGDEATVVGFGGSEGNRHPTTYFRSQFQVADRADITGLVLEMVYDDGAAVYLNGTEVLRAHLPADAGYATFATTLKGQDTENLVESFVLPLAALDALVEGENVLAIEIHQGGADSPDIGLDARLSATMRSDGPSFLIPGMNRVSITSYDNLAGAGVPLQEATYDVWYEDGGETLVSGTLNGNLHWTPEAGPYRVQGNAVVASGATLSIAPGTTVFFDADARLTIRGRLSAVGTESDPIWFTRRPGTGPWGGLQFLDSVHDNRIAYAILEYGITNDGMIGLDNSRLTVEHSVLDHTDLRRIRSNNSSLIVRDSTFTDIFAPDQAPTTDNRSEHIWGGGIPAGGEWIVERNTFGTITGHNDAIDFDAPRGVGRYAQIRNNEFRGGGDDALDMTGDVYVVGNVFRNYIKDRFNTDPGQSNTISASSGEFWVIRNTFENVQHASLIKEDAFMHFLQNTVVSSEFAPLYFDLPGQTSGPGRGALVEGNLFAQSVPTFDQVTNSIDLRVNFSLLPAVDEGNVFGVGNVFGDARLANETGAYRLQPGSPAVGRGPNGADMGAAVSAGVTVSGVPAATTNQSVVTLAIGGAGMEAYRYQVNDGPVSSERSVTVPIVLSGLTSGTYEVRVWGRDVLGSWQAEPTVTPTWTVDPFVVTVRINEVLADNQASYARRGVYRDAVELYNFGGQSINLQGYSLSDRADAPRSYVFPAGTILRAGEYLVLSGDTLVGDEALSLGFGLNSDGESLFLFDATGQMIDAVTFGAQLTDRSIGRVGRDGQWALTMPTLGSANVTVPLGDADRVLINEWYTNGDVRWLDDYIELYNPEPYPIELGGYALSDEPFDIPFMSVMAPLTFLDARGFLLLTADGDSAAGPDHLSFRLSAVQEHVAVVNPHGELLDQVFYFPQTADVSQGLVTDGTEPYVFMDLPSPGLTNGSGPQVLLEFDWNSNWRYDATGSDLGAAWREVAYDDSAWSEGPGLLGRENETLPAPLRTEFAIGDITYYFRKSVMFDSVPASLDVQFSTIVDDGFVVYVNGQEVMRRGMPDGPVNASTLASRSVNEAAIEGPFVIPSSVWQVGENVIAVEVHQTASNSSDLVFGMSLVGSGVAGDDARENQLRLLNQLRITELMYHPARDGEPEYLELQNIGDAPIDLSGVRLAGGIDFVFPQATLLDAGQYLVITDRLTAFAQKYGTQVPLAGEYGGRLNNGGEEIVLQFADPLDTAILRFDYDPLWAVASAGGGASLNVVDEQANFRRWADASSWYAAVPSPGTASSQTQLGDLNGDNRIDATDIDLLCQAIREGTHAFDLNGDRLTTSEDFEFLIRQVLGTTPGDANLDGVFNSRDFVLVFTAGKYEQLEPNGAGWAEGDWNCDGQFTSRDLVVAFQAGGYVAAAQDGLSAIPVDRMVSDLVAALLADELPSGTEKRKSR
jgi:hypothetical protein